eukprot:9490124-Pyramimonas_sp.AAC.1
MQQAPISTLLSPDSRPGGLQTRPLDHRPPLRLPSATRANKRMRRNLWVATLGFKRAMESVEHESIWAALTEQSVETAYVALFQWFCEGQTGAVKTDVSNRTLQHSAGHETGRPAQLLLSNYGAPLDRWPPNGSGKRRVSNKGVARTAALANLRFADDVLLASPLSRVWPRCSMTSRARQGCAGSNYIHAQPCAQRPGEKDWKGEFTHSTRSRHVYRNCPVRGQPSRLRPVHRLPRADGHGKSAPREGGMGVVRLSQTGADQRPLPTGSPTPTFQQHSEPDIVIPSSDLGTRGSLAAALTADAATHVSYDHRTAEATHNNTIILLQQPRAH